MSHNRYTDNIHNVIFINIMIHQLTKLTLENWRSEYQRLQTRYRLSTDKNSLHAQGLQDHIQAVRSIIGDLLKEKRAIFTNNKK